MDSSASDVVVIGAGPAGLAAAITVSRYSELHVTLIERNIDRAQHIGELIPAGSWPLLEYLGVADPITRRHAAQTCTLLGSWFSEELFAHETRAPISHYALNRHILHQVLIAEARNLGVRVCDGRFVDCSRSELGSNWRIQCAGSERLTEIAARFMIDASGRRAVAARKLARRQRFDTLIAVIDSHLSGEPFTAPATAMIEATRDGWWYRVDLSGCGATTMLLTDRDTLHRGKMTDPSIWAESLRRTSHISRQIESIEIPARLTTVSAVSALTQPASGMGWIAVGEAAAAFDPISSLGIGYGLLSGIEGARCAISALNGETAGLAGYSRSVEHHFTDYMTNRRRIYSAPRRWSDSPFWRERAQR